EHIVQMLPGTTTIEVVIGNSPFERFWLTELRRAFQPFTDRLRFDWLNELPFEEIRRRVARLPGDSAVVYALMLVDAEGVPYEQERALEALRRDSHAPIFGLFDSQLGRGIVGGSLYPSQDVSQESARVALRILNGAPADSIPPVFLRSATPVYDWRELTRWKIDEQLLSPGSLVQFRRPSLWQRYHWYMLGAFAVITCQGLFIVGMF